MYPRVRVRVAGYRISADSGLSGGARVAAWNRPFRSAEETTDGGHVLAGLDDTTERSYLALAEIEVRHEEARLDLDRQRRLLDLRLIGQAVLDGEGRSKLARGAGIANQREQVVVAEREIDMGRTALKDTFIRAPFSGVSVSTDAQPGEVISPASSAYVWSACMSSGAAAARQRKRVDGRRGPSPTLWGTPWDVLFRHPRKCVQSKSFTALIALTLPE